MRAWGRTHAQDCQNAPGILSIHLLRDIFADQNQRRYKQMIEFVIEATIELVGETVLEVFSWLWFRVRQLRPGRRVPLRLPGNRVWLVLVAASALLFCAGQGSQVCYAQTQPIHSGVEISAWPELYTFIHESAGVSIGQYEQALQALPFERIELERTACFGACPIYTVTLFRDGKARYHGEGFVKNEGDFTGRIHISQFGRLCFLLERLGFSEFEREYSAPWTCSPTVYLRVWRAGEAEPIVVKDYGSYGPIELWRLQQAVGAVAGRIEWKAH
jgi:hypothetical protein